MGSLDENTIALSAGHVTVTLQSAIGKSEVKVV